MPLYEYECDACHHRFELIQKFSDPPIGECPVCGGTVQKLLSSPAIQFKGTGWYITDYARKGTKDGGKPDTATTPASGTEAAKGDGAKAGGAPAGSAESGGGTPASPADAGKS